MEITPQFNSENKNHAIGDAYKMEFPTSLPETIDISKNGSKKSFICELCNRKFTQKVGLQMHYRTHTGEKPYICKLCHKAFARKNQLGRHLAVHRGDRPHSCKICNKSFSQKGALKNHILVVHSGLKPYKCEVCNKELSSKSSLRFHSLQHSGKISKSHVCTLCNKSFIYRCRLKVHLLTHTGDGPYVCEVTRERRFKCHLCNKSFFKPNILKQHLLTHTDCKPHTCELCSKSFSRKGYLKQHYLIHSGEKLYSCEVCDKKFSLKNYLKSHLPTHSRKVGEPKVTQGENYSFHEIVSTIHDNESAVLMSRKEDAAISKEESTGTTIERKISSVSEKVLAESIQEASESGSFKSMREKIVASPVSNTDLFENTKSKESYSKVFQNETTVPINEYQNISIVSESISVECASTNKQAFAGSEMELTNSRMGRETASRVLPHEMVDIIKEKENISTVCASNLAEITYTTLKPISVSHSISVNNIIKNDFFTLPQSSRKAITKERTYICNVCNMCDLCDKAFTRKYNQEKHRTQHTAQKQNVCEGISCPNSRKTHPCIHSAKKLTEIQISSDKTQEKLCCIKCTGNVCDLCSKAFTKKSDLQRPGESLNICKVCKERCPRPDYSKQHFLKNSKEKHPNEVKIWRPF